MKEIGLLFTPENRELVRRNLKTQTRRGMKVQPTVVTVSGQELAPGVQSYHRISWGDFLRDNSPYFCGNIANFSDYARKYCPYGNPEAIPTCYYLKEPVQVLEIVDGAILNALIRYTDDGAESQVIITPGDYHKLVSRRDWRKPSTSMFMLRSFARTRLPGVRTWPEQLGDMSEADALAEGIEIDPAFAGRELGFMNRDVWKDYSGHLGHQLCAVESYQTLWDSINGKTNPWHRDLWVWCISFSQEVK